MLYMTEGSYAWVAVKYNSDPSVTLVENTWSSTNKNFYVSHSILRSAINVSSDILMVESSSSVYANMSTAAAFSKVRDNILGGCSWFKDTHGSTDLTGWMSPYASGAHFPDAKLVAGFCDQYLCCSPYDCSSLSLTVTNLCGKYDCSYKIFDSCGNSSASRAVLNANWRLRSGHYQAGASHSIWFRVPLSLRLSASLPPLSVPVSQGLIAMYTADSWRPAAWPSTVTWMDLSGSGNHVSNISSSWDIMVARPVGAPAYITGTFAASMKFPSGILPSSNYTLFFVARYDGAARGRILQGFKKNMYFGFDSQKAGVAYKSPFSYDQSGGPYVHPSGCSPTQSDDIHGFDWVIGVDRTHSFRSNGVDRTTPFFACEDFDTLAINIGWGADYRSDFAIQSILVYDRKLSDTDVLKVEAWLTAQQPAFTPANLQVCAGVEFIFVIVVKTSKSNQALSTGRRRLLRFTGPRRLQWHLLLVSSSGFYRPSYWNGQHQ
jgi:hypothetical protein